MKRVLFAVVLGTILGALDGLAAWFEPDVRSKLGMIVMLSSVKSMIVGLAVGIFAVFVKKPLPIILFAVIASLAFAWWVASSPDPDTDKHYYAQIMTTGGIVGLLLGYATQRYGGKIDAVPSRS